MMTDDEIRARIAYCPTTGKFTWRVAGPGIAIGKEAGCAARLGYLLVKVGRVSYRAHRLAWFLSHGFWPEGVIDHINGDPMDNRLVNLRDVDHAANMQNQRRSHRDNFSCGLLGVTWNKQHKRWQSKIQARKVRHHVGYFASPEEAHEAYLKAKARLHIEQGVDH